MSIRLMLADDHTITRKGLSRLIETGSSFIISGEVEDGREAVDQYDQLQPDVVLMDIAMPILNGVEATRRIVDKFPGARIIILSMHSDKEYIVRSLEAGAMGYVLKDCDMEELISAIETVCQDKMYISPDVSANVVDSMLMLQRNRRQALQSVDLTPRELEVLQLIAEEKSSKQIADILNISARTVENHRRQIMDKLNVRSIAGLTKYAIKKGIISLD